MELDLPTAGEFRARQQKQTWAADEPLLTQRGLAALRAYPLLGWGSAVIAAELAAALNVAAVAFTKSTRDSRDRDNMRSIRRTGLHKRLNPQR